MIGLLSENLLLQMTVKLFGIVLDSRVLWNGSPNTHRSSTQVVVTELRSFQSVDLSLFAVRNIRPVPQIAIFWQCLAAKAGKKEPSIPFPVTWRLWCHHFHFRFLVFGQYGDAAELVWHFAAFRNTWVCQQRHHFRFRLAFPPEEGQAVHVERKG